jgi:hypothetical protein
VFSSDPINLNRKISHIASIEFTPYFRIRGDNCNRWNPSSSLSLVMLHPSLDHIMCLGFGLNLCMCRCKRFFFTIYVVLKSVVGMVVPSNPKDRPMKWKYTIECWPEIFPKGIEQARCWCSDLCDPK